MFKALLMWLKCPIRNYSTSKEVDLFLIKIIDLHKNGRVSFEFYSHELVVLIDGVRTYNIWNTNKYHAWLCDCSKYNGVFELSDILIRGEIVYKNTSPSYSVMYDFLKMLKKSKVSKIKNEIHEINLLIQKEMKKLDNI